MFTNRKNYEIPQGTPISAVYSNIYLIEYDKIINDFVTSNNGLYKRYCDDVIIILPAHKEDEITELLNNINIPKLCINISKTEKYYQKNKIIYNKNNYSQAKIQYLGFTFDGKNIRIREQTIFKFYKKMYHKIQIINKYSKKYGRNVFRKRFYKTYTHLGAKSINKRRGNFITYVRESAKIMNENQILGQIKNHWKKAHKKLIKINKL